MKGPSIDPRFAPDDTPLILRREAFGGILFDPLDATHIEVDEEAFDLLRRWMDGEASAGTADERALIAALQAEVPSLAEGRRPYRLWKTLDSRRRPYPNITVFEMPSLVDLQITHECHMACPHCYVSATPDGDHMPFELIEHVLREVADAGVCQLAIGGGEPLLHPRIVEILALARALGMVPNVTTTGHGMRPEVLEALARHCGAVALSLEDVGDGYADRRKFGFRFFERAHARLRAYDINTTFQVVLSAENVHRLEALVDYSLTCPDLYGVIFLAFKPVGRGDGYNTPLSAVHPDQLFPRLCDAFLRLAAHTRVGYDCCLTPGIVGIDKEFGLHEANLLEGCTATRTSVGVMANGNVVPCTFTSHLPLGNLKKRTLADIWWGPRATAFRAGMEANIAADATCSGCEAKGSCMGGCSVWDLIRCTKRPSDEERGPEVDFRKPITLVEPAMR